MAKAIRYVGLDVHKETIAVAIADAGGEPARSLSTISNGPDAASRLARLLGIGGEGEIMACYEAGPCGYPLQRRLNELGVSCVVVAPSLVPTRPGDRVKTDRRDALKLARLLRGGELTPVSIPSEEREALRDLARCREDGQQDLLRARHRLSKFLLRLEIRPPEGVSRWSRRHRAWLEGLSMGSPVQQVVLGDYLRAVDGGVERVKALTASLHEAAEGSPYAQLIAALQVLRGVGPITAITLAAELGDLGNFLRPEALMAYGGLVPSEHSSGSRQKRGRITKTGNSHIRRVAVEAAWHYRHRPALGKGMRRRQAGQPESLRAIAWTAQERLHLSYRQLAGRGLPRQKLAVAIARDLLGFVWAIAREMQRLRAGDLRQAA